MKMKKTTISLLLSGLLSSSLTAGVISANIDGNALLIPNIEVNQCAVIAPFADISLSALKGTSYSYMKYVGSNDDGSSLG